MPNAPTWFITTFYRFTHISDTAALAKEWTEFAESLPIRGLLILGTEGFNITCAALSEENLNSLKAWVVKRFDCPDIMFKDSRTTVEPFEKFKAKIRNEIVTAGSPDLIPDNKNHNHLSPSEWNRVLKEESDFTLIDTRNWYEVRLGTFKGAVDPKIEQFTEFPEFVEQQNLPKDKKLLIFCTGGIRCEKGLLELEKRGYKNVYQLEGGILNYLEQFPNDQFGGECFVFDSRVAVDQELAASAKYKLCPHCGQPSEVKITCARCETETLICVSCVEKDVVGQVCSKNCAHHLRLHPGRKGKPQVPTFQVVKKPRITSPVSNLP